MQIDPKFQRQGIGTQMINELEKHIGNQECFCLPHSRLEGFYGQNGFFKISVVEAPTFLAERLTRNHTS